MCNRLGEDLIIPSNQGSNQKHVLNEISTISCKKLANTCWGITIGIIKIPPEVVNKKI